MCSPQTTKTSSNSSTTFDQQSISDFLSKMSQQSQSNTAQQGTSSSTTGPSDAARALIEQATKPVSADQINQYMSPYQQQVIDATMAQLQNQYGQQAQQLKGNAISQGALGGDRARVAQAVLAGQQGLNTGTVIGGLQNQNYAQALAAAQMEQNRALQGAGMMGTTTTGTNAMTGTQAGTTTGEQMSHGYTDTRGQSQTNTSTRSSTNPGGVGYLTAIAGALADGGRVHKDAGGSIGWAPMPQMPMGWSGPSGQMAAAPVVETDYSSLYNLGKKARKGLNQTMDQMNKKSEGEGDKNGQGGGGGGGGGQFSQWFNQFGNSGSGAASGSAAPAAETVTTTAPEVVEGASGMASPAVMEGASAAAAPVAAEGLGAAGTAGAEGLGAAGTAGAEGMGAAGAGAAEGLGAAGAGAAEGLGAAGAGAAEGVGAAGAGMAEGIGSLVSGIASMFSDERVKENKKLIGKTFDGQNIYSYNYKGHPATQIGLMAQEVERNHPEAVGAVAGIKTVRNDVATHGAASRGHFAEGGWIESANNWMDRNVNEPDMSGLWKRIAPNMSGGNAPPPEHPVARGIQNWMDANPVPQGGLSEMAKQKVTLPPASIPETPAFKAGFNAPPSAAPFQTAIEPAAPIAGGLTPLARPGYMAPEDIKPVQTFKVTPGGETMAEPGAAEIAPGNDNPQSAGMVSERGLARSLGYEGFKSKPYWDHGQWSIGYGSKARGDEDLVTEEDARTRHAEEMTGIAGTIKKHIRAPLNQDQFDGLALFTRNLGEGALEQIAGDINKGDFNRAADRMETFNKVKNDRTGEKELSPGLLARRHDEAALVRNTSGEASGRGLVAPEQPATGKPETKPPRAPQTGVNSILERLGIASKPPGEGFKPAYPGQEPDRGGILQRLGINFNPLNLSDRERMWLITSGLGGFGAGANAYTAMRGQDIGAAAQGQQLAMQAMKMQQELAAPRVINQKIGPYGEKFDEYGHFDPKLNAYVPQGGGAGGTSSPYGGQTGDAYNQVIAAVNSGKTGEEFAKMIPPQIAAAGERMGTYQEPPADEKSPQGRQQLAIAQRLHPDYDPSQYSIIQKTRQEMLSGATAKTMKAGTTAINHLVEFFEEAEKNRTSDFPAINRAGNYVAEVMRKPGGQPARNLAGSASEEATTFYRGSGGAESDIARELSTLNENQSTEQRKAMAGVLAKKFEGKINSLDLSRDEAFKGAKTKAPPIMTPEAQEELNAMKLYSRDPNITMTQAREAVKQQAGGETLQMVQVDKDLIVPAPAIDLLVKNPSMAAKFDEAFKRPGAAAKVLAAHGVRQ